MKYSKALPVKDAVFKAEDYIWYPEKNIAIKKIRLAFLMITVFLFMSIFLGVSIYRRSPNITFQHQVLYSVFFLSIALMTSIILFIGDLRKSLMIFQDGYYHGVIPLNLYLKKQSPVYTWSRIDSIDVSMPFDKFKINPSSHLANSSFSTKTWLKIQGNGFSHKIYTPQLIECLAVLSKWAPDKLTDNAWMYVDNTKLR